MELGGNLPLDEEIALITARQREEEEEEMMREKEQRL